MPDPRLRRTLLMTPGNREDRLRKAASYAADALVYDLEDSVPPGEKARARQIVANVLSQGDGTPGNDRGARDDHDDRDDGDDSDDRNGHHDRDGGAGAAKRDRRELCVRINALDTPYGLDDLEALPLDRIDSIMVPKVESADALRDIDARLARMQANHGDGHGYKRPNKHLIELIALIETPRGVLRALEIADATPRTSALFFGSGDYTSALGAAVTETTLHYPRSVVAAAAAAAGLQAIDAAFFQDVKNAQATRDDALIARAMGYAGKVVFHPNQVAVVNDVFSPSAAEIERARRIVAAYEEQIRHGHGTGVTDGVFVAIDLVPPARRLLRLAELLDATSGFDP